MPRVHGSQQWVRTDDGHSLAVQTWPAAGPPVVLLHSGICDMRSWYATAEHLAAVAQVVAYDRRGYGDSEPPSSTFRHVDDLLAVLDQTVAGPAWLVASSAGGRVALDAALIAPERVAGLVLLAPALSGAPPLPDGDPETERLYGLAEAAIVDGRMSEAARLELWLWLDGPAGPEGRVGGPARDLAREMDEQILRRELDEDSGLSDRDHWAQAPQLEVPTLVAWGELDIGVFTDRCAAFAARLPRAETRVLAGVAHLPYLERPELISDLVAEAMGRTV